MKMEEIESQATPSDAPAEEAPQGDLSPAFTRIGMETIEGFHESMLDLGDSLLDIESFGGPEAAKKAQKLIHAVKEFEPSITMIGQIKSGKTSLVNAMAGRPELLPADVNPWTSVVTSLHLNPLVKEGDSVASFQFFDQDEWDHLVENGGRIGELSSRAGADDELQKVREQIAEMREKTKARLGRKFELLLGQVHNYRHLDDELLQRYVCMGDDFDDPEMQDAQGQFADITKSADLYMSAPALPIPLCIRDTPGVNDTFMMREQITINALRGSRICVVVLSATQALSSMDMGLIRLIANVRAREVVIFVNRVDELADPAKEIPEIRESILKTLSENNSAGDIEVLFGSAYWANMALQQQTDDIVSDSKAALMKYAEAVVGPDAELSGELAWQLSGLPHLYAAIGQRITEGEGAEMIQTVRKRALNHIQGLKASSNVVSLRMRGDNLKMMEPEKLGKRLDEVELRNATHLKDLMASVTADYAARVDQLHKRFLDRALESLLQHLETNGEQETWQYSPDGLRILLRSSYQSMRKKAAKCCDTIYGQAAGELTDVYRELLSIDVDGFTVNPPNTPQFPSPVSLGQTIALDLQSSWWSRWWKRRKGYRAYAESFYELIEAETAPIINDMKGKQADDVLQIALRELDDFLSEQGGILTDVSYKSQISVSELKDLFGITAEEERNALFQILLDEFAVDGASDEEDAAPAPRTRPAAVPSRAERPSRPIRPVSRSASQQSGDTA